MPHVLDSNQIQIKHTTHTSITYLSIITTNAEKKTPVQQTRAPMLVAVLVAGVERLNDEALTFIQRKPSTRYQLH